ncbi:MAG: hypothetical protein U0W24_15995 [Bacteroidales bacterium]
MKKKLFGNLLMVLIAVFINSCQWVTIDLPSVDIPDDQEVSFATDIQPIFNAKCTDCHSASSPPKGIDLTEGHAYNTISTKELADTVAPSSSLIYAVPSPTGTHSSKYSNEQAAYVLKWIEQGAKDN